MARISISNKVHIPLIASIALGFLIILGSYFKSVGDIKAKTYQNESKILSGVYHELIKEKDAIGLTNAINYRLQKS